MKYSKIAILLIATVLLLAACRNNEDADTAPDDESIEQVQQEAPIELEEFAFTRENFPRMDGSPSTAPLAQAVACVLLGESRENIADMTIFSRTTQAFRNFAAGLCDILIVGEPTPGVLDELAAQGFSIDMAPIAVDALVFIVNASNPVDNLTSEQVRGIYAGEITNWQQVGGDDIEITAFQRNEEASSHVLTQKLVMDWRPMAAAPIQNLSTAFEMGEGLTAIKGFDGSAGAIGYTMYYYAETMGMAEGLKIIAVDGVKPDVDTIAGGTYPFLNPYYAVISAGEPGDGYTRIMFNWLLSDEGQALISQEGYVPVRNSSLPESSLTLPVMRWSVRTDHSNLTTFAPPHSMHSRLQDGQMPELVPSNTYGMLLPYSSAVTMNDGSLRVSKYGLVAIDGTVITDLIYDNVVRASYITLGSQEPRPAYNLYIDIPESEAVFEDLTLQAACALDGSWITPFEFVDIVFSDEVIFLMRDHESFDIDVYDYNGRRLYNILELEWADDISEDTWSEVLVYGAAEGVGFIKLNNDTYGLMDVMTGDIRRTDFVQAFLFSEGLAAVTPSGSDDLWGFVNKELEFVIQPGYVHETAFRNNQAIVETPDGGQHIIDKQGEILFSVTPEFFIMPHHDSKGFSVGLRDGWDFPKFYASDFTEIEYPAAAMSIGPESAIQYIGDGWYFCMTDDGMWLFTSDDAYRIAQDRYLSDFVDGFIIYNEFNDDFSIMSYGVMTPDGRDIILPEVIAAITPVAYNGTVEAFILNTSILYGLFIHETYTPASYRLVSLDGSTIMSGYGVLSYDQTLGLFYAQGTDHFAWMDAAGATIISIPSMAYSFD